MDIREEDTGFILYPEGDGAYFEPSINRTVAPSALEIIPEAVGTWANAKDPTVPVVTLNEDGTCKILGGDGVWGMDYYRYLKNLRNNLPAGSAVRLDAKINGNNYFIEFNVFDNGTYNMWIQSSDLAILPHSEVVKIPEN